MLKPQKGIPLFAEYFMFKHIEQMVREGFFPDTFSRFLIRMSQ